MQRTSENGTGPYGDSAESQTHPTHKLSQQSLARLRKAFSDKAQYKTTNHNWFFEFKRDHVNVSDEFRDGRSFTAMKDKNVDATCRLIETDRQVTYHEIHASLGIGMSQIQSSLHKPFGYEKAVLAVDPAQFV
ncbi:hypothetical protein EVAR_81826_1 [Eumeta japonica]|uniref:Mariner Mos1 transposase n=1 Tax=Eumeta variegata TaxID=151549 RepID=A0A4C1XVB2_EUMVA|nr:hypothetical protein EVAR_81826_1 [Eumeta japonica]